MYCLHIKKKKVCKVQAGCGWDKKKKKCKVDCKDIDIEDECSNTFGCIWLKFKKGGKCKIATRENKCRKIKKKKCVKKGCSWNKDVKKCKAKW